MTPIYHKIMEHHKDNAEQLALEHQVWDNTPWVIDVHTGSPNSDKWCDIHDYCCENFGQEAWPIHGKSGYWYKAGATVEGWTWIGFHTKEMMEAFIKHFPEDTKAP